MGPGAKAIRAVAVAVAVLVLVLACALLLLRGRARAVEGGGEGGYPPRLIKAALALVRARAPGYGPPTDEERRAYAEAAAALSAEHGLPVPPRLLESMHSQECALAARRRTAAGRRRAGEVAARRRGGAPPLAIARALDLPPMFVVKAAKAAGLPPTPAEELAAARADLGSALHQRASAARAERYEREVGAELEALGAGFRTEADLRRAGSRLTPDFLLDAPLAIGAERVAWVDAKNYAYYGNRLTLAKLKKQARKYTEAFGPGAMVFAGGYARGAPPLGALLLGPGWGGDAAPAEQVPPARPPP